MKLKKDELYGIVGGASGITASFLNAIARGIETLLDLGRSVGTAVRRIGNGSVCPL